MRKIFGSSDEDEVKREEGVAPAQLIAPESIDNGTIYRVYLSASSSIKKYRDTFRKTVLNEGDLVIETCGELNVSKIMGRIKAADAVVIAIDDRDGYLPHHSCNECLLRPSCRNNEAGTLDCLVSEFEYYCACYWGKPILFLVNKQDTSVIPSGISSDERVVDFYNGLTQSANVQKGLIDFNDQDVLATIYHGFCVILRDKAFGLCPKDEIESDDLLCILNQCVQRSAVPQTIGQYIITSGEMNANSESEIHLLTNEMCNYDFTTMSSLAISLNIRRGVQYYYYGTSEMREDYEKFTKHIGEYHRKSLSARNRVVAWIRQAKCDANTFSGFLSIVSLCNSLKHIVKYLLLQCNQDEKTSTVFERCEAACKSRKIDFDAPIPFDRSRLCEWISGEIYPNQNKIFRFIDTLSVLIEPLKADAEIRNKAFIQEFLAKLEALNNMALLTRWQGSPADWTVDLDENGIDRLIDYFRYKDSKIGGTIPSNILISEQIENWLRPKEDESIGADGEMNETTLNGYLNNIHFCLIQDDNPYVLGYNFVLFLDCNPQNKGRDAAAWYTTYVRNANKNCDAIDNSMIMVNIEEHHSLYAEIQAVFRQLILSNPAAIEELRRANSNILSRLSIGEI